MKNKIGSIILCVIAFSLGILFTRQFLSNQDEKLNREKRSTENFKFINPLLECDITVQGQDKILSSLRSTLQNLKNKQIQTNKAKSISIYYRDLNNGPWVGINEKETFTPASLMKVPIMFFYFRKAETDPDILKKPIAYVTPIATIFQQIKPKETMTPNQQYTIEELIKRMIVFSDNQAAEILLTNIDPETIKNTYEDLGVTIPQTSDNPNGDFLSVKDYAAFFRILYNASYLSKTNSEKALEILSQSSFKDGIVAGIPSNVTVAHKFGERKNLDNNETQIHDCGIIYPPKNSPYLVCIMTRGDNPNSLISTIQEISHTIYSEITGN